MASADRLIEVFNEAKARAVGPERDDFLAEACKDDAAMKTQVFSLLQAHEGTGKFLQGQPWMSPELEAELAHLRPEKAGERIGRYKLLQEIGEGGFGVVWMAEQVEPVSRRVALKIVKLGMDTREVIARFEAERQALAMMDHPNIAQVFDAGATQHGRPFFVMELVKGVPITEFSDARQLGTRERLELFDDVCSAINHAHQKGIIHRDIKPSNVMITLHGDKPVVKVIDFGIAKATQGRLTDKTLFTRFEQFVGTPVYMSPEQAATSGLDIDTRSDIYALGILLYELLTGKPPFDPKTLASAGYEEMRRIIREVEPPKPSSRVGTMVGEERTHLARTHQLEPGKLSRLVEPDLDWIVMKAIDKDRTRRYETANGLALDIQRFLADEPVSATPPSAGYRFGKFVRRNETALRVAATIAVLLVAATLVSSVLAIRATQAKKLATERLAESERARAEAEDISAFLSEIFQSPDPARDGRTITVAETLDKAAKKLETDLAGQPARQARLRSTLSDTYHALGLYQQAIPLQEKVLDYHRAASGPEHPDTLVLVKRLAMSYHNAGRRAEALKLREEVLALRRRVLGPEHPETIGSMSWLAISYDAAGRREEALKLREEVLALRRKLLGPEHRDTIVTMTWLASFYNDAGHRDEALKLREELVALQGKMLGPEHPNTLAAKQFLADSYDATGRRAEALELREEVLLLRRKVLGTEHPDTLTAMQRVASSYAAEGRGDEALKLREEVIALRRKVSGPEHPDTLLVMHSLAASYDDTGRRAEALKLREEVLLLRRKVLGPEHPRTLEAMQSLAVSYDAAGRRDEALKLREETLSLRRKVLGPEHRNTIESMAWLAVSYDAAGRRDEAVKLREEVLSLRRKVLGPKHPDTIAAMISLEDSYRSAGEVAKAEALEGEIAAVKSKAQVGAELH